MTRRISPASVIVALAMTLPLAAQSKEQARQELMRRLQAAEEASLESRRAFAAEHFRHEAADDPDVAAIVRVLDNTKIDLDFTDASLEDIIGFIREYAKINIEIDQKVREEGLAEKKITFKMRDAILRNVLDLLLRQYALEYTFDHKVFLIVEAFPSWPMSGFRKGSETSAGSLVPPREGVSSKEADEAILEKMKGTHISLSFTDAPLPRVLGCLVEFTTLPIVIDAGSVDNLGRLLVTFRVDDLPFDQAFDLIAKMVGLHYVVQGGEILVFSEEAYADANRGDRPCSKKDFTPLGKDANGAEEYRHDRTGIVFVRIPAGEFDMGSLDDEVGRDPKEVSRHVRIDRPFLLSKTEVTNAQFRLFAAKRRLQPGHSSGDWQEVSLDGDDQPVVCVNWLEVYGFCQWAGLRLPTDEEWEYVARGGDGRMFPWGDSWPPPPNSENYADETGVRDHLPILPIPGYDDGAAASAIVGRAAPNPFGVSDLGGNVWEFCCGRFEQQKLKGPTPDPRERFKTSKPDLRGGSWYESQPSALRCAERVAIPIEGASPVVGFRVALDWGE